MNKLIWKIIIGILSCVVALLLPYVILSSSECVHLVRYYGYWGIAFTFICFLYFLFRRLAAPSIWRQWLLAHRWGLISALAVTVFFQAHEKHEMKILFDEFVINLTAMEMHYYQEAVGTSITHHYEGYTFPTKKMVDKRPILFPFVVSLVHSATGFRVENVYYLNAVLTFGFLLLVYVFVSRLANKRYGILCVILFATFPLLAQNANGGGFEVLNLTLIVGLMLLSRDYLENEGKTGLNLMVMGAVLLANTRYESILYLLVPVVIVLLKAWRTRHLELTWYSVFTPLFLILPLLSNRVFRSNDSFFDYHRETFFGFENFQGNLIAAVQYLFDLSGDYTNSVLISTIGLIALLFALSFGVRILAQRLRKDSALTVYYLFLVIIFGITLLMMNLFWGKWTDPLTSRFSLSLHLILVVSIPVAMYWGFEWKRVPGWLLFLSLFFVLIFSGKAQGRSIQRTQMFASIGYNWMADYAAEHLDPDRSLFAAAGNGLFILKGMAAISTNELNEIPEKIMKMKEAGLYKEVYIGQFIRIDRVSGTEIDKSIDRLSPRFQLEPVAQRWVKLNYAFRISRIVGVSSTDDPRWVTADVNMPPPLPATAMNNEVFGAYALDLFRVYDIFRAPPSQLQSNE